MLERYAPNYVNMHAYTNASCRGDGIRMATEAVDAAVQGNTATGMLGPDVHVGFWSDLGAYFPGWDSSVIPVNENGERFVYDGQGYGVYDSFDAVCLQPNATTYAIFDAENPAVAKVEGSTMEVVKGSIFQADTLEALAEAAGIDAALASTIEAYNAAFGAGEDDPGFGVPNGSMNPAKTAPFYAVRLQPYAFGATVGLAADENCQVVNSAGDVVPNLYATGEMCFTGSDITFLGCAFITGRTAGEHAKAAVQG